MNHLPSVLPTAAGTTSVARLTVQFFSEAVACSPRIADRLTRTPTSVHIRLLEGGGITLRLDCQPPEFHPDLVGHAETAVTCSAATWVAALRGDRALAMAIATGAASYEGPVRKLLSCLPILRPLDHSLWERAAELDDAQEA